MVMTKDDILQLVRNDQWMMEVLHAAEKQGLPEWMIGAGFLRNKVWDHLHGIQRPIADTSDIDLVYFDSQVVDEAADQRLSEQMDDRTGLRWEIVNQAYTHRWRDGRKPYVSTVEALSEWVETATCVAVAFRQGQLRLFAPVGISDLVNLVVRPSPHFGGDLRVFHERIASKKWLEKWPLLRVEMNVIHSKSV